MSNPNCTIKRYAPIVLVLFVVVLQAQKYPTWSIVFSICTGVDAKPWLWGDTIGNLWRSTQDIQHRFATGHGVLKIFDEMSRIRIYNKPNAWNDADMLQAGN